MRKKKKLDRILIKLSGEYFSYDSSGILNSFAKDIKSILDLGVKVAIVVGGGNILRGRNSNKNLTRITADHMGMIATIINGLALIDLFSSLKIRSLLYSSRSVDGIVPVINLTSINTNLENNRVVVFCGGTGNPFVSTDSAASLRAIEINADAILKATNVEGVYDRDPSLNITDSNTLFRHLSFDEVLKRKFNVMDQQSFFQCQEFNIPICIFNAKKKGALVNIINGIHEGTWITNKED